ncbi:outer membrane beta-barrel protein [Prevotella disiens]|uniref:TonB-dependent receptor n=1 Tax=Prevotella disiens TaxID=28130 RepID=A0A3E4QGY3_9BACT|nr:outer membrane beta-barrel protein [Prevotella disiens]RGK95162.1 TonB-dependent receptor [Prevotella disiens]
MKNLIITILAFVTLQTMAQELTGKIVDENQRPVSFANIVVLSGKDSTLLGGTVSNVNGAFKLEKLEKGCILRVSYVSYKTSYTNYIGQENIILTLEADSKMLQEVVVKCTLPKTILKGEGMTTNIAGTLLEKTSSVYHTLNLIPMVSVQNESITILGRGTPLIYINGRPMQSAVELQTLKPEEIKKVEVISNPGAKYPASTTCVLKITTRRNRYHGFGISNQLTSQLNEKHQTTWIDVLGFNKQSTHWDFNAYLYGNISKRPDDKQMRQHTLAGDSWLQTTDFVQTYENVNPYGKLSASYLVNDSNSIGASVYYDCYARNNGDGTSDVTTLQNGNLDENTFSEYHSPAQSKKLGSNIYYYGKVGQLGIDFNTDYIWYVKKEKMNTHESYMGADAIQHTEDVNTHRKTYNWLIASKLVLSYPIWNGNLSWGVEASKTNRKEHYSVLPENKINNVNNHINELMQAMMLDYTRQFGTLSVQAGLRYEHLNFKFYDHDILQDEVSKKYNDIFPSFALSMPVGKTQMQLSYGVDVSRPGYSNLRSGVQYDNRFTYEGGNPLLRPTLYKDLSYTLSWKWITFTSMVQHIMNEIVYLSSPYKNDPRTLILSPVNMPSYNKLLLNLSLQPKIGIYQLSFNASLFKQWYKMEISDGHNLNAPMANFNITNTFDTKWATFSLGFQANTAGGNSNIYTRKAGFACNFSAYKRLLKDRLTLSLYAYDIFGTNDSKFTLYSGPKTWTEFDNYSCSYVQLSVKYQFNIRNSKYKGTGAGQAQKNRM